MQEGTASRTAEGAAAARALHLRGSETPVFADPYAAALTSATWRRLVTSPLLAWFMDRIAMRSFRPVQGQVVVRSRYAEDVLGRSLGAGVRQYVVVGAGFDSFALRRRDLEGSLEVFELDHPATQALKMQRLQVVDEELPANLHFVAVDFERETVADALARSTFVSAQPAFFSWLGTTPYLTAEATLATFAAIASIAADGSEVVFDYLVPDDSLPQSEQPVMRKLRKYTEQRGEPLIGAFEPQALRDALRALGYAWLEDLDCEAQVTRYFAGRQDGLRPMAGAHLVHVRLGR